MWWKEGWVGGREGGVGEGNGEMGEMGEWGNRESCINIIKTFQLFLTSL